MFFQIMVLIWIVAEVFGKCKMLNIHLKHRDIDSIQQKKRTFASEIRL